MKRVIEISEEDYNFLIEHKDEYNYERTRIAPILNSTPLTEYEAEDCISRSMAKEKKVRSEERHEYVIPVAEIDWLPSVYPKSDNSDLEEIKKNRYNQGFHDGYKKATEQANAVIEDIKTEIKQWYWQSDKQAIAKDPCVIDAMIDLFIRTIDKHINRKE